MLIAAGLISVVPLVIWLAWLAWRFFWRRHIDRIDHDPYAPDPHVAPATQRRIGLQHHSAWLLEQSTRKIRRSLLDDDPTGAVELVGGPAVTIRAVYPMIREEQQ